MCFTDHCNSCAPAFNVTAELLREVPRDQALGLRLIALARAAAALHIAQVSPVAGSGAEGACACDAPAAGARACGGHL